MDHLTLSPPVAIAARAGTGPTGSQVNGARTGRVRADSIRTHVLGRSFLTAFRFRILTVKTP